MAPDDLLHLHSYLPDEPPTITTLEPFSFLHISWCDLPNSWEYLYEEGNRLVA